MLYSVIVFYEETTQDYLQVENVLTKKPLKLKSECCEKYKKGKRCKRCPCFDLLQ